MQIVPHFAPPIFTEIQRSRLLLSLNDSILLGESFPSCDSLTRYLAGYFTGFYPNVPFTHAPTFKLEACSPELCLAMMAIGAAHRYESLSAVKLFHSSKARLLGQERQRELAAMERLIYPIDIDAQIAPRNYNDMICCLLCLIWFATWQKDKDFNNESLILRGLLAQTMKLSGLDEGTSYVHLTWETWARDESARRAKFFAFCILNIQDIAYRLSPIIWAHEIRLKLPCSCPEWTAPDPTTWSLMRQNIQYERGQYEQSQYGKALKDLLSTSEDSFNKCLPTPVSNYVLLHGLLQQIMWNQTCPAGFGMEPVSDCHMLYKSVYLKTIDAPRSLMWI